MTKRERSRVRSLLRRARAIIVKRGWCVMLGKPGGPRCPVGAMTEVVALADPISLDHITVRACEAYRKATRAESIGMWIAHPARTTEQVLAAFDRAIARMA